MPRKLCITTILAVLAAFAGGAATSAGETVLYVFTWKDYFDGEAVRRFEQSHDCRVEFNYYDSNEAIVGALRGGGHDVITPAPTIAAQLKSAGLVRNLDHALLPNLKYVERAPYGLTEDMEMLYSVPYTITVTGVGYNRKLVPPEVLGSWDIFSRKNLPMAMLNDPREIIGAGLKFLGHDINSTNPEEIAAAGRVIKEWKGNLVSFDVDDAKEGLRTGALAAIQAYNGDAAMLIDDNPDIGFFVPKEGSALNSDEFVIGADCDQPELAHAFIKHFLDPEIAAMNMEGIFYLMPNHEAMNKVSPRFRNNPALNIPEAVVAKCEPVLGVGDAIDLYDQAFLDVIVGK